MMNEIKNKTYTPFSWKWTCPKRKIKGSVRHTWVNQLSNTERTYEGEVLQLFRLRTVNSKTVGEVGGGEGGGGGGWCLNQVLWPHYENIPI